ncbi:MAG: tRNA (adenosine(37)-N6)-dimethylallyltransferase MiaA [Anaerolineaceae bacterium]
MSTEEKKTLIIILGATAVGKTTAAIVLARRFGGEIVSADSRQLYRGMNIGTAKPSAEEMNLVPHHLIDVADPDQVWSLGIYQREAYRSIRQIHGQGKLPFLVGGTGQYIRSIMEGWLIPPQEPDIALREAITHWAENIGSEALYDRLERIDPDAARQIDHRNVRRTIRALEVIFKTGERFSDLLQKQTCRYHLIVMGINRPREVLYDRIDQRVDEMLDQGLVQEVQGLLEAQFSPDLPTMSAIGYAEIIQYLQGKLSLEEAVVLIKRNTRIFVRRQANWFKLEDERIKWFTVNTGDDDAQLIDAMETHIKNNL